MTLTEFVNLVESELPIRVEFFDSGGHRFDDSVDEIYWNDECWHQTVRKVEIDDSKVYVQLEH